jgi:hypothetical protein
MQITNIQIRSNCQIPGILLVRKCYARDFIYGVITSHLTVVELIQGLDEKSRKDINDVLDAYKLKKIGNVRLQKIFFYILYLQQLLHEKR